MSYVRETGETYVAVELRRGGSLSVSTPVPFLTHMVETFLLYSGLGGVVEARVKRDLDDNHHVIEDVAVALGRAIDKLLGDRTAIARFGWAAVPMDDGIVERILFTTRCRVIASQEADERIAKFRIRIYDFETVVLMVTSVVLILSVLLPTPMTIVTSVVGIIYSALVAWLKLRRSPLFLEWSKSHEVRKRTLTCLNNLCA